MMVEATASLIRSIIDPRLFNKVVYNDSVSETVNREKDSFDVTINQENVALKMYLGFGSLQGINTITKHSANDIRVYKVQPMKINLLIL